MDYVRVIIPKVRQDALVAEEKGLQMHIVLAACYHAVNEKNWNIAFYAMNIHVKI